MQENLKNVSTNINQIMRWGRDLKNGFLFELFNLPERS